MILRCPSCTGGNYYAVLKTSGNRILRCPVKGHGTVAYSSSLALVCLKQVGDAPCGKPLEVTDQCPNCGTALVPLPSQAGLPGVP